MTQRLTLRSMSVRAILVAACILPLSVIHAQTPATPFTYEVVSIHPHDPTDNRMMVRYADDGYTATNMTLHSLIMSAFDLKTEDQLLGLHGAVADAHFDVHAKPDAETAAALKKLTPAERRNQLSHMMQAMLEDRFQLKTHMEKRELPTYNLIVAKGGFKLKEADPANTYENGIKGFDGKSQPGMTMVSNGSMISQAIPMSNFAGNLQGQVHRIVVDKTGLTGKYDITLKWSPDDPDRGAPDDSGAPPLFTALQEQLGLKLEPAKTIVDVVVVDHIETPSAN
jgi:uncharacterized protein (TIGR03435 family)